MSVVEMIKAEIQIIIDEEIKTLEGIEGRVTERVQETSEKIKNLVQSYSDLEKTLGNLPNLGLAGLTSDTAKVVDWEEESKNLGNFVNPLEFSFNISAKRLFYNHPSGPDFNLEKKKYKLLVAFIPIEESA